MVAFQWFAAFAIRSFEQPLLRLGLFGDRWMLMGLGVGLQLAAIYWAPLQAVFQTVPFAPLERVLALGVASSLLAFTELAKRVALPRLRRWGVMGEE